MKEGDKVHCIQSYYGEYTKFFKDNVYEISDIVNAAGQTVYVIKDGESCGLSFFKSGGTFTFHRIFSNYFIDLKKLRKLKLDKIAR